MATTPRINQLASGRWRLEYVDGWGKVRQRTFPTNTTADTFFREMIEPHLGKVTEQPAERRKPRLPRPSHYVPAARLRPLIERWIEQEADDTGYHNNDMRRTVLCSRVSGLYPRMVWSILNGEREHVTIDVADRILIALELNHLWHLPPELGGFADIYFHEDIVGAAA